MRNCLTTLTVFFCCGGSMAGDDVVDRLAGHLGKTPALVVFVCHGTDQDVATVASLVDQTPWKLFCRSSKPGGLERLRGWARDREVLGSRVSVVDDESMSLCLASEMADAVVLAPGVDFALYEVETMRVLRPGGLGVSPGKLIVKPKRSAVDEWRHPYHEPDNNVVSRDSVARLPGELRFQTHPVFAAMPNQSLFAGGRIFFFSGHIAFHEREEPLLNTLTVLNAYNGLLLWTRPLHPDFVVHNIAKFATDREVVFAEGETLWMLDAATGKELGKFAAPESAIAAGDTDWKWVVQQGHRLWAALGPPDGRVAPYRLKRQMGHWPWDVANDRYSSITNKFGEARTLAAFAYPEMKPLWAVRESEPFDARTLCMDRDRIFALSPERYMVVRSAETGSPLWRHAAGDGARALDVVGAAAKHQGWGIGWSTYCCARAANGVVCIAGPPYRKTVCVGMEQGDLLWASDSPSPHPFFLGDALYVMPRVAAPAASCQVVEPRTGKLLDQFSLGVIGSCTR
ncbi:MAG: hypothetical protein FJ276_25455, partial [Planctomycetes bacterium]|nr:hypothetical protein [Planctomycetota bacterium]